MGDAVKLSNATDRCKLLAVTSLVSKQKLIDAYGDGIRRFGEMCANEFAVKASYFEKLLPEIIWHFIGPIKKENIEDLEHQDCSRLRHTVDNDNDVTFNDCASSAD